MNVSEAYQKILDAAEELRDAGIGVTIAPSKSTTRNNVDPLPRDKWVIIIFKVKNKQEAVAVSKKADELGQAGITFDTSGTSGEREWEVDWSFNVRDVPDGGWKTARGHVEDMIDGPGVPL
jgi:hypothetical protein